MTKHLAILGSWAIEEIFSGRKKIEGRFSKIKIDPFGKVARGDVVLMKIPGEKIVGQFIVDRVIYFDHPRSEEVELIKETYGRELAVPVGFWQEHEKVNFVTLMFIKSATKFIVAPVVKKKDLRPWVVLEQ
ncbi:MAG: hypothetical protein AAB512_04485 [Patescibacteria group bacterium]